ncbi:hypothetical protein [Cloacibacterium sp.]|uniref:hypothetical protein n=1 Tax=Cloacibacterium sp. TaxID=1913682 RepID=UPI0039E48BA3
MNENLTQRILEYLDQKTNYAVIISGKYGIGKTFYLENTLFPEIKKILNKDTKKEQYKTIKISLFGVSSIDEIEKLIFFEAYPILKNKGVKVFGGFLKGASNFFSVDLNEVIKDSGLTPSEINNYENFVVCFDDIDRKSPNLDLSEVYGFINNLVENKNAKVILIANEDTLRKEVNKDNVDIYSTLREKVIGISFPYIPDNNTVINNLFENYKTNDIEYYNFLKSQALYIINIVNIKDDNLRNVIFFLEHFKQVYKQAFSLIDKSQNLKTIKNEILNDILKFTLPIAFEYKLGKLNDSNLKLLNEHFSNNRINWDLFGHRNEESKTDYADEFVKQYDSDQYKLKFFESILKYVIGYNILDTDKLLNELKEIYKSENANFTEKEIIFNSLRYWGCVNLNPKDYKSTTKNLIKLIDDNKLSLDEYTTVFHYITRFDNPLNLNIDKLKNKIIKKINTNKYQYIKHLNFRLSIDPTEKYLNEIKQIANVCIEKNNRIYQENELNKLQIIFEVFEQNFDEFIENSQNPNNEFLFKPFFEKFKFSKLWNVINKLSNSQLIELGFLIEYRYRAQIYPDLLVERDFILQLKEKLAQKIISKKSNKLDKATYKNLIEKIDKVIPNFN